MKIKQLKVELVRTFGLFNSGIRKSNAKTVADWTSDFCFLKFHGIGADFYVFILIISERSADFCFCKIHRSESELAFLICLEFS